MRQIALDKPISTDELVLLSEFLAANKLAGLFEIHGFFTAAISGPNMIMPSEWIEYFDLSQDKFSSIDEGAELMSILMRSHNEISRQLQTDEFTIINPLMAGTVSDDEITQAKAFWSKGYMQAVAYDSDAWLHRKEVADLILPILVPSSSDNVLNELIADNQAPMAKFELRKFSEDKMLEAAIRLYQYWSISRGTAANSYMGGGAMPGRNDLCSCGSGKKFKKCCLN